MRKRTGQGPKGDLPTVLREPAWLTACVYVGCVLVGAAIGLLIGPLAGWLVTLPWTPMQGPAELVASVPAAALSAAGALGGLVLGLIAQHEQLTVRLADDHVVLVRKGHEQSFPREAIALVFPDGKRLVLLDHRGGELTRQKCDLNVRRVTEAFTEHGYVSADADPYKDEFRRWVPDLPGLPRGANAILGARQEPLKENGSDARDVRELREELARLGVVVRDEKRRQYVRTLPQADPNVE